MIEICDPRGGGEDARTWTVMASPFNPAHYYGCCGLLEIASCLSLHTRGWWEGGSFKVTSTVDLPAVIRGFKGASVTAEQDEMDVYGDEVDAQQSTKRVPITLTVGGFDIFIEWYRDPALRGWTGNQDIVKIFNEMRGLISRTDGSLFAERVLSKNVPAGFDSSRVASVPKTAGFSLDAVGLRSPVCPAAESLPLVGIQRWRPVRESRDDPFSYWTWAQPLDVNSASQAGTGLVILRDSQEFFWKPTNKSTKDHKIFSPANRAVEQTIA